MQNVVYIVMACGFADDSYYGIIENRGCGLFDICTEVISH